MGERDHDRDQHQHVRSADKPATSRRRVSVPEAADLLGLSVEAIRGRIKRGTIDYERDGERVYVLVDTDKPTTGHGQSIDKSNDQTIDQHPNEDALTRELVDKMQDQIDDLRHRLDKSENARWRADEIIMQLTQTNAALSARVPELEASPHEEPQESPESSREAATGTNIAPASASPQTGSQPRSWWRTMLGI